MNGWRVAGAQGSGGLKLSGCGFSGVAGIVYVGLMMNEWNIRARAHTCQACEKTFVDQQSYHTLLFDEKQDFRRLDVCEQCWQGQYSQGASERKGFVSYWQGVY